MTSQTLRWMEVGSRWHAKCGSGAYQIRARDDGRFDVFRFDNPKDEGAHRATADTLQGAKDFVAIEVAKQPAA